MINILQKIRTIFEDINNFGFLRIFAFGLYIVAKKLGYFLLACPSKSDYQKKRLIKKFDINRLKFPQKEQLNTNKEWLKNTIEKANKIIQNQFLAFGMDWQPINFEQTDSQKHWSRANLPEGVEDIKLIWEPARFDWLIPLGKAIYLTGEKKYYSFFKEKIEDFILNNPVNMGLNWQSGQEISIRLVNFVISYSLFYEFLENDIEFRDKFIEIIYFHALRIKPSLIYAFAQNNNHLLSEAVGLITAGIFFFSDKKMIKNKRQGMHWLNYCLKNQFYENGMYLQHSTNYHRLVLDWLIWVKFLEINTNSLIIDETYSITIKNAIQWLLTNTDPVSGEMANYGHNDGAFLFQFAENNFRDARPSLDLLGNLYGMDCSFSDFKNEKANWLGFYLGQTENISFGNLKNRINTKDGWAIIRSNQFNFRPGHADQNHVDIWFMGKNIICDPGTFSYNARAPWNNSLAKSKVHNTVTLNQNDQMKKIGTFRWRNWSVGYLFRDENKITGIYDDSNSSLFTHQRVIELKNQKSWIITDNIEILDFIPNQNFVYLNWLIRSPLSYQISDKNIKFIYDGFYLDMEITCDQTPIGDSLILYKEGKCLDRQYPDEPTMGWYSPTYHYLIPALSIITKIPSAYPQIQFISRFNFTKY